MRKKMMIPMVLCLGLLSVSAYADDQTVEEASVGIKYELTQEMQDAGLTVITNGLSPANPIGEMDLCCKDILLGAILVMPEADFNSYQDGKTAAEVFTEYYPQYHIDSETNDDYAYVYMDCTDAIGYDDLEEDISSAILDCKPLYQEFLDQITFIPVEIANPFSESLTFTSYNLDQEEVTDAILSEKDYTIINVWATYCDPCINEMPALAEWESQIPDNTQLLYLCSDISSEDAPEMELAETIVEKSGINRKNVLILTPGNFSQLTPFISAVPTTFFVDKNGKISEKIVVGADMEKYKSTLEELLK